MERLNKLLENLRPSLCDANILYLPNIKAFSENKTIILYGAGTAGQLVCNNLNLMNIYPAAFIDANPTIEILCGIPVLTPAEAHKKLPKDSIVIVCINDYLASDALYAEVQNTLSSNSLPKPYYLHEFSRGFYLGAHNLYHQKETIREAYFLLGDEKSKDAFLNYVEKIQLNFGYDMSFTNDTFGIPRNGDEEHLQNDLDNVSKDVSVILCSTIDYNPHDPHFLLCQNAKESIYLFPIDVYRHKLKEKLYSLSGEYIKKIVILDYTLSNKTGITEIDKTMFISGTPVSTPSGGPYECMGITLDDFVSRFKIDKIGLVKLDMPAGYIQVIDKGKHIIDKDHPTIIVSGFRHANQIWEAIIALAEKLPEYKIYLRRFPHENIITGHCVYCVYN